MRSSKAPQTGLLLLLAALSCLIAAFSNAQAQGDAARKKSASAADDDVVRIATELVQTDITVLDKQGRFVEGLQREQFQLSVEGKPQAISFFERVGGVESAKREAQAEPSAVTEPRAAKGVDAPVTRQPTERGRIIFFFIDDVHLAPENLARARQSLLWCIDNELKQNDQAAIVSTSGQIGFLQQLTGNRSVLREAATRLTNQRNPETYAGRVPISEYDAAQVSEHFNRELFTYLVAATVAEYQTDAVTAANIVRNRVHQIGAQSRATTTGTLGALLGLMRSSASLPGRKIVFFMTDGFVADPRVSNVQEALRQITRVAAQVGAVIYPLDARGVFADPATDASENRYPDFTGSVSRNLLGETTATQEPLQLLAAETGGRAFLNSNSFSDSFTRALDESSSYYLLAWRPLREEQQNAKSRISVSIKDRPDLKVRVRRGFIEAPQTLALKQPANQQTAAAGTSTPEDELRSALGALYPLRSLPVALSVGYLNTQKGGTLLLASMQFDAAALPLDPAGGTKDTEVDVLGAAIDDRGALASFKQKLTVKAEASGQARRAIVWNQQLALAPGLYQVRVAVRERRSGRTGSAMQWLEVPNLAPGSLNLSSIFLGERGPAAAADEKFASAPRAVMVDVDHRFARASALRFQVYIYNAAHAASAPDVQIQARILSDGVPVITLPPVELPTDTTPDQSRLPYWAELALDKLTPGRYVLQVTATDRRTKTTALQEAGFIVE